MSDIVTELRTGRGPTEGVMRDAWVHAKMQEAADLITALRAENERLKAALEIMSRMGGYTKLHPDETASAAEQNTYSWGVTDGYKEMAAMARAALEEK